MINFGDDLTIDNILKRVSSYQIFKFYYPKLDIGKVTNSPFRSDKNASAGLFVSKDTLETLYNDLGSEDSGNWIWFLKKLYGIEFKDVLNIVNRDMALGLMGYGSTYIATDQINSRIVDDIDVEKHTRDLHLNVRRRPWRQHDADYWLSYGINRKLLGDETYPIFSYWFNDWKTNIAEKHAYSQDYYFDGKYYRRKIYQPFSKTDKWKSNINGLVIDGIKNIPKSGDLLIITKSRKDRLVLNGLGYCAISTTNESSWIPDYNFNKLNYRYKKLLIFFDNDEAGMKFSNIFSEKYKINRIFIPNVNKEKDIAEFRFKYGELSTKKLLNELLY